MKCKIAFETTTSATLYYWSFLSYIIKGYLKRERLNQSLILSTQEGFDINKGKIQEEDTQVVVSRVIPFAFSANSKLSGELKSSKVLRIILP